MGINSYFEKVTPFLPSSPFLLQRGFGPEVRLYKSFNLKTNEPIFFSELIADTPGLHFSASQRLRGERSLLSASRCALSLVRGH